LVIWGVAAEAIFTIALFIFDEGISNAQQSKIASLDHQLLQIRFPRSFDFEKFKVAVQKMPPPASFEVLYDANAPDALQLAMMIWGVLFNVSWHTLQTTGPKPLRAPPPDNSLYANLPWTIAAGGESWGLAVVTNGPPDFDKNPLGSALVKALLEAVSGPPSQAHQCPLLLQQRHYCSAQRRDAKGQTALFGDRVDAVRR
jgi:hypothetical protein